AVADRSDGATALAATLAAAALAAAPVVLGGRRGRRGAGTLARLGRGLGGRDPARLGDARLPLARDALRGTLVGGGLLGELGGQGGDLVQHPLLRSELALRDLLGRRDPLGLRALLG